MIVVYFGAIKKYDKQKKPSQTKSL